MFRSQTDEQLAARHDKHPWRSRKLGIRYSVVPDWAPGIFDLVHEPRSEKIPTRDPEPWRENFGSGFRHAHHGMEGEPGCEFDPRPEFARPPVNRILEALRLEIAQDAQLGTNILTSLREVCEGWLAIMDRFDLFGGWVSDDGEIIGLLKSTTPPENDHARKVLTRLSALNTKEN